MNGTELKCTACDELIDVSNKYYKLGSGLVCPHCAATLTLEELSFEADVLDVAVYPNLVQAAFTVLQ